MTSLENMTVVLAHGAWADGSSWSEVIGPLTKKGLQVVAAPLPLTSLSDDAAALRRTLARTEGPVIVAGHAYAGAVIATADDERVLGLVYIAALAPAKGESVAQVFYRDKSHPMAPELAPDQDGWIWMPDEGFSNAFAHHATADQIALAKAVQRPISVKCIQETAPEPAWNRKPSWFLIAEEDRMINPKTQHFMAERMGSRTEALAVDHTPLLTAPETVVEMILTAAHAV
ncbi:MAG TPA: alpha/beta hydrolase [Bryobacteraceae bacterium]|jgi:pimeloyl-ACP methyl ester carboxylesterase|nr:alpha/beta hydrolase [Bryobacteraceae bacterium]